mmetsp:Transcript_38640/g.83704  ORF Transcript_38640/g.83704 Transcript_38640/m.83704 type:complete len:582 (+) Transcript_38640:435-2180(+)
MWFCVFIPELQETPFPLLWYPHVLHFMGWRRLYQTITSEIPRFAPVRIKEALEWLLQFASLRREVIKMLRITIGLASIFHLVGCSLWVVKSFDGEEMELWMEGQRIDDSSMAMKYFTCLYLSVGTCLGYGAVFQPYSVAEKIHSVLVMMMGVIIFAVIVSNILTAWEAMHAHESERQQKIDSICRYLDERQVSKTLKYRMLHYYDYVLDNRYVFREQAIMDELPVMLKRDLCLELFADIVQRVSLFNIPEANRAFITAVVLKLSPLSALPNDKVIEEGEMGSDMYIVKRGALAVWVANLTTFICVKRDGDYFGEIALVLPQRRTATVIAMEHSQLYSLGKNDLDAILSKYPAIARAMRLFAEEQVQVTTTTTPHQHPSHPTLMSTPPSEPCLQANQKTVNARSNPGSPREGVVGTLLETIMDGDGDDDDVSDGGKTPTSHSRGNNVLDLGCGDPVFAPHPSSSSPQNHSPHNYSPRSLTQDHTPQSYSPQSHSPTSLPAIPTPFTTALSESGSVSPTSMAVGNASASKKRRGLGADLQPLPGLAPLRLKVPGSLRTPRNADDPDEHDDQPPPAPGLPGSVS